MASESSVSVPLYHVVVNHEEQYSIWPDDQAIPAGWRAEGPPRPKDECLRSIEETWTDMRPLSVRRALDADDN